MTKREITKAAIPELVEAYREAARANAACLAEGDYRPANKAPDSIAAIYSELRRRGPEAQQALAPLLADEDHSVRGWAASRALEFAPGRGRPVLEELVSLGGLTVFNAEMTLHVWKAGRQSMPVDIIP